jgi:ribose 5-phosphate isomerase A
MTSQTRLKKQAAEYAVDNFVEPGMLVGLGHGSTASFAIHKISNKLQNGDLTSITAIACSKETEALASSMGIPIVEIQPTTRIDVTIDGADEVDPDLNLIKGGGGALTREKIVAQLSRREVIVVDDSKTSQNLGENWGIPVEVIPFGWQTQMDFLETLGAEAKLRTTGEGSPFLTDQHNYIIDANFGVIENPIFLADELKRRTGIVEHGIFIELVTDLVVASENGIRHLTDER